MYYLNPYPVRKPIEHYDTWENILDDKLQDLFRKFEGDKYIQARWHVCVSKENLINLFQELYKAGK